MQKRAELERAQAERSAKAEELKEKINGIVPYNCF